MITTRKAIFFPLHNIEGKPNCKRFFRIESDGSVTERAFLNVEASNERERLICIHYLRHMVQHFVGGSAGVRIISRDDPWDFRVQVNTDPEFNIEITAIADSPHHFEINKREERFSNQIKHSEIPLRELEKLDALFPDPHLAQAITDYKSQNVRKEQLVKNPLHNPQMRIFLSAMSNPNESLEEQMRKSISKKIAKNHLDKDKTVLIIDNRTSAFDAPDYYSAAKSLESFCAAAPFPEIWFYTGYYSDIDGNNAEFSFAPLKATNAQLQILSRIATHQGIEKGGRIVW